MELISSFLNAQDMIEMRERLSCEFSVSIRRPRRVVVVSTASILTKRDSCCSKQSWMLCSPRFKLRLGSTEPLSWAWSGGLTKVYKLFA
ncbi:hypothetical protein BpHYR1_045947 [Brachionus plicatilis]|uniref:Uncharacterized protein n=1 Tax=Brachionus plicatilis TaxID=10195 RepID=A0A3M7T6J9_BRAPC|nr:hypothetical protein BpHYR1_045947 [Brachionus plicatilis]